MHVKVTLSAQNEAGIADFVCKVMGWQSLRGQVRVTPQTGGCVNQVFKCSVPDNSGVSASRVLCKIFGRDSGSLSDREAEVNLFKILAKHDLVQSIYATFDNGLICGFARGRPLKLEELRLPQFMTMIAAEMAVWHRTPVPEIDQNPSLFSALRRWIALAPSTSVITESDQSWSAESFLEELPELERLVTQLRSPVVLCHGDLNAGNIIYNESAKSVKFIDHEYSAYQYRGFDIGNHFCEFCGVESFDLARYPSQAEQEVFATAYLRAWSATDVTATEVQALLHEANIFAAVACLYWGVWALVQSSLSEKDFDYVQYAWRRLRAYVKLRRSFRLQSLDLAAPA
jgi:thiamine kinase-like enzyme